MVTIPTNLPQAGTAAIGNHDNLGFQLQALVNAAQQNTVLLGQIQQAIKANYLGGSNTYTGNNTFAGITTFASGVVYPIRIYTTSSGRVSTSPGDYTVVVNKSSGSATGVDLYGTPKTGAFILIKDGKGDASTNNITIVGSIDNSASLVINANYGKAGLQYNGSGWNQII